MSLLLAAAPLVAWLRLICLYVFLQVCAAHTAWFCSQGRRWGAMLTLCKTHHTELPEAWSLRTMDFKLFTRK